MLMAPIFAILFGSADMVVTVVAIELWSRCSSSRKSGAMPTGSC